jgi:hypothetical protein
MPKRPDVFQRFREAPLLFAPTYKYDPGTLVYDTSSKARAPAWCDRVLFSSASSGLRLQCAEYGRCDVLHRLAGLSSWVLLPSRLSSLSFLPLSDHVPVYAAFNCRVARIDAESRAQVAIGCYVESNIIRVLVKYCFCRRR